MMRPAVLLLLLAPLWAQNPSLDERLGQLESKLEAALEQHHVPGMAIAVVSGDSVLFARGFGFANRARQEPATVESIFCIGSTTKAFTAALVAALVDEGRLAWDDPAALYLPDLRLRVDEGAWWLNDLCGRRFAITLRDLLCHRSGFTRLGLLWAAGGLGPEQILVAARRARPFGRFRRDFLYNNVMFLAAGMAAARAAQADSWHSLLADRLLGPLGMEQTTSQVLAAAEDPAFATGYRWDAEEGVSCEVPLRDITCIGPAGSICSNVLDMARWLRLQLAGGVFEGERLISEANLLETRSPQITMGNGDYGLGWMLRSWEGRQLVEHGGNIDGYAAQVALLPEEDLGFVLLTNTSFTTLQTQSIDLVFSALLGSVAGAGPAETVLAGLPGRYAANFGPFKDAWLTVEVQDGVLFIDVPGQMLYELKPPDDNGLWAFAVAPDAIQIEFLRDESGAVSSLLLHQAGYQFECLREGVEPPIEVPLASLREYLGSYRSEEGGLLEVLVQNQRLAVDVPEQMVYELYPPDEQGLWAFRVLPQTIQVAFERDAEGQVCALVLHQGGQEFRSERVATPELPELPTADALLGLIREGLGGLDSADIPTLAIRGEIEFVHQGVVGSFTGLSAGLDKHSETMDFGPFGWIRSSCDGARAWSSSAFAPAEELSGRRLLQTRANHPLSGLGDLRAWYPQLEVLGAAQTAGRQVFLLELSGSQLPSKTLHVDAQSGQILREETVELMPGLGEIPVVIDYGDFRPVGDLVLPHRVASSQPSSGETVITVFEVELGVSLTSEDFR